MALPKIHGGLGFKAVKYHSLALLSRWFLRALDEPESDWAGLYEANLKMVRWINHRRLKRNRYQFTDLLLLGRPNGFGKLQYSGALWKAWIGLCSNLVLSEEAQLPGRWLIEDLLKVLPGFQDCSSDIARELASVIGRLGARSVQNLWCMWSNNWRCFRTTLAQVHGLEPGIRALTLSFLEQVTSLTLLLGPHPHLASSWQWTDQDGPLQNFSIPNGRIYKLLLPICNDFDRLNRIWDSNHTTSEWNSCWDALWSADLLTRQKVFIWRIISQGLYTQKKAFQIRRDPPYCLFCLSLIEDIPHLFQTCIFASSVWQRYSTLLPMEDRPGSINLLEALKLLARHHPDHTARLALLAQILYALWSVRNKHVREGTTRYIHPDLPFGAAIDAIRSQLLVAPPGRKAARLLMAKQLLENWRSNQLLAHRIAPHSILN
ncbi:unnamed protein product [Calypogeia fissa]